MKYNVKSSEPYTLDIRGQIPFSIIADGAEVCCTCTPNKIVSGGDVFKYRTPHIVKDEYDPTVVSVEFGYIRCPNCGAHLPIGLCVLLDE